MNEGKKDRRDPIRTIKARNPVAKNATSAIGGGAAGAHKDKKKAMKQGDVKHKKAEYAESLQQKLDAVLAEAGTRYTGDGIHPKLVEVLKQRGYKGPYQLGKLKKWFIHLKDDVGAQATDEIMVTGNDVEYDEWVLKETYGEYAFGSEGGYMTGDANRVIKNTAPIAEEFDAEYDDEAGMADNNLETLKRAVDGIDDVIQTGDNLPEWCQEKIAVAKSMLVTVWDYMLSDKEDEQGVAEASALEKFRKGAAEREKKHADAEKEMNARHARGEEDMKGAIDRLEKHVNTKEGLRDPKDNPCWKGYKPVGTKKKGGKTVPNCVPKEGWTHDSLAAQLFETENTYEERLTNLLNKRLDK